MSAPTMLTTVTLLGSISFTFPSPVGRQRSPFALSYGALVPLPETLHRFLAITGLPGQGLPREIGKLPDGSIPPGGQTPAPGSFGIVPPNGHVPVPAPAAADAGIHLDGPTTVLPVPVSVDYDGTATLIDQGLQATHLPYDAVPRSKPSLRAAKARTLRASTTQTKRIPRSGPGIFWRLRRTATRRRPRPNRYSWYRG